MELLEPDFSQEKPTFAQVRAMCQAIPLTGRPLSDTRLTSVLEHLRESHANGGALFASFEVGTSDAFDWFASRNRLSEFGILRRLFDRREVTDALPELKIMPLMPDDPALAIQRLGDLGPVPPELAQHGIAQDFEIGNNNYEGEFRQTNPFLVDGELARKLFHGGAYTRATGDGRIEKTKSLAFYETLCGLRYAEVTHNSTHAPWTSWFGNIAEAWDWTSILFDRRARTLSILATTDTD